MKAATIVLSDIVADSFLTAMFKTGYEHGKYRYTVTSGLPEDAKLLDCRLMQLDNYKCVALLFGSESFPDVTDPWKEPSLTIKCERVS